MVRINGPPAVAYHKQVSPVFLVTRNDIKVFGFGSLLNDPKSVLASSHYALVGFPLASPSLSITDTHLTT